MNFLFLTTMMILIFTLASTSMTTSLKTTARAVNVRKNQMDALYAYNNQYEKDLYNQSKKALQSKSDLSRKEKRHQKKFSPRRGATSENSKLNLYPLISAGYKVEQKALLQQTLKNLIEILYAEEDFYAARKKQDPNFLDPFVKSLINDLKRTKSLAKVSFSTTGDREFYLTLCKGSYPTKNRQNPLLNYITLQAIKDGPPLVFPNISAPLIRAYFGEKIAEKIFNEEEKLYFQGKSVSRLNKEALEKLLSPVYHNVHSSMLTYSHYTFDRVQTHCLGSNDTLITKGAPVSL